MEIDDIATSAMLSKFHYQRMFHALTGMNYRIIEEKASTAVGKAVIVKEPFVEIPAFVEGIWKNGTPHFDRQE
ncbi:hypothetical protein [Paenibacillus tarimensis]|uniref:hypothetical protein n=1 Tax=Paenibacillus tarimensis TaxID=416012 RepID=UPI001F1E3429|nr:hypothetical protein [Paenibacillus tarimensis]MCF2944485.1 hypothetical protein [Paenibacillus tarimensis]